jgi:hypothetical protein
LNSERREIMAGIVLNSEGDLNCFYFDESSPAFTISSGAYVP